jgi:hypothetical protein
MKNNFLFLIALIGIYNFIDTAKPDQPKETEIIVCQDQAENFGNGKVEDIVSNNCIETFKIMANNSHSMTKSLDKKTTFYGYKNIIIIQHQNSNSISTNIIAGNSTGLEKVKALVIDEKNLEVAVLEESGDILFFSSKITGNVAPYRILHHKELLGTIEISFDNSNNYIIAKNIQTKKLLYFSRLANTNARTGNQKLEILKSIDLK